MKLETILDAAIYSHFAFEHSLVFGTPNEKCYRQYRAFRARILRMDADKEYEISLLVEDKWNLIDETRQLKQRIAEMEREREE